MERHETGRPTARFPSAVPVLHGEMCIRDRDSLVDVKERGFSVRKSLHDDKNIPNNVNDNKLYFIFLISL